MKHFFIPHDYASSPRHCREVLIGGPSCCENFSLYHPIAKAALDAGLRYISDTKSGPTWAGTEQQFRVALEHMPAWARDLSEIVEAKP